MARIATPLTNTEVKQAKTDDKILKLSDGDGLQLRVKPNGSKSWILDYFKPFTKKRTSLGLGSYPDVSLADARKKRASAKELLADDIDPKEHRDDLHRSMALAANHTFQNVTANWFDIKKSKITENTAKSLWRSIEKHVFPSLGHRPIDKIFAPEAIKVLKPLSAKGTLETVSKLIGYLNEIMNFAVNTGILHHNSLAGIRAAFDNPKVKHRPTLKPEELPELMKALSFASIKITTRCLIEWQLHTMVRPSEAAEATWAEINFVDKTWVIPASRMKGKKRSHTVPLTDQAIAILEIMKPISMHREHVFPSDHNPSRPTNKQSANMALKRMGFKGRLVAHGMRSIASTTMNDRGFNGDVIEAALSHVDKNAVRSAYNHSNYLERRVELMNWWSNHIQKCSTGDFSLSGRIAQLCSA